MIFLLVLGLFLAPGEFLKPRKIDVSTISGHSIVEYEKRRGKTTSGRARAGTEHPLIWSSDDS
jgi:hypothetical protein